MMSAFHSEATEPCRSPLHWDLAEHVVDQRHDGRNGGGQESKAIELVAKQANAIQTAPRDLRLGEDRAGVVGCILRHFIERLAAEIFDNLICALTISRRGGRELERRVIRAELLLDLGLRKNAGTKQGFITWILRNPFFDIFVVVGQKVITRMLVLIDDEFELFA